MRQYRFVYTDVFTESRFGGNQLAIFIDGRDLSTEEMQKIAQEMNFSETTFVFPPETAEADWKVRIFTPGRERPFSGHPTLGTAYVLAHEGMISLKAPKTKIILELGLGLTSVTLEVINQTVGFIEMEQQTPTFGQRYENLEKMAEAFSIDVHEIEATGLPIEVVSCGLPYLIIPINSLRALEIMKPSLAIIEEIRAEIGEIGFFVFSKEVVSSVSTKYHPDIRVQSRMFFIDFGLREDPASGSASGSLGCYLVKNGVIPPKPTVKVISEQGYQMLRPSTIHINIGMKGTEIIDVRVGGHVIPVAEGMLSI